MVYARRLLSALLVSVSLARAQAPQPDGAGLARGVLPESWAESAAGCEGRVHFRVHEYNADLFILRQSGCTNYEKPFLYLIFGDSLALLLDSGAKGADVATSVRETVQRWAARHGGRVPRLVVAHSHGHGDHVAGDAQLSVLPATTVVGTSPEAVQQFFGLRNWPDEAGTFELGGRVLDIVPIPGHERASIAVYDRRTGILLTGDTMYPGRLYVADGEAFRKSVQRLVDFSRGRLIAHVLGAHIEQARTPYLDYPVGTRFQPDEHALELTRGHLLELRDALAQMDPTIERRAMRDFTIWPVVR
jgi:hydroxyacylglutathione hydrolase